MKRNLNVLSIEKDDIAKADQMEIEAVQPSATWGLDRIDQRALRLNSSYEYFYDGRGAHVYVLDTGIFTTHQEFEGRAVSGYSVINDGRGTNHCKGHGTHVAGTIGGKTWGVAKKANLYAVRVLNCDGKGSISGIIAGMDWVVKNHRSPAVMNMSIGSNSRPHGTWQSKEPLMQVLP